MAIAYTFERLLTIAADAVGLARENLTAAETARLGEIVNEVGTALALKKRCRVDLRSAVGVHPSDLQVQVRGVLVHGASCAGRSDLRRRRDGLAGAHGDRIKVHILKLIGRPVGVGRSDGHEVSAAAAALGDGRIEADVLDDPGSCGMNGRTLGRREV
jgi:hypothetical protein